MVRWPGHYASQGDSTSKFEVAFSNAFVEFLGFKSNFSIKTPSKPQGGVESRSFSACHCWCWRGWGGVVFSKACAPTVLKGVLSRRFNGLEVGLLGLEVRLLARPLKSKALTCQDITRRRTVGLLDLCTAKRSGFIWSPIDEVLNQRY